MRNFQLFPRFGRNFYPRSFLLMHTPYLASFSYQCLPSPDVNLSIQLLFRGLYSAVVCLTPVPKPGQLPTAIVTRHASPLISRDARRAPGLLARPKLTSSRERHLGVKKIPQSKWKDPAANEREIIEFLLLRKGYLNTNCKSWRVRCLSRLLVQWPRSEADFLGKTELSKTSIYSIHPKYL